MVSKGKEEYTATSMTRTRSEEVHANVAYKSVLRDQSIDAWLWVHSISLCSGFLPVRRRKTVISPSTGARTSRVNRKRFRVTTTRNSTATRAEGLHALLNGHQPNKERRYSFQHSAKLMIPRSCDNRDHAPASGLINARTKRAITAH